MAQYKGLLFQGDGNSPSSALSWKLGSPRDFSLSQGTDHSNDTFLDGLQMF